MKIVGASIRIIALVTIIVFSLTGCENEGGGGTSCTHNWEWTVTTPATEEADGVETKTCSLCGATDGIRPIDKLIHVCVFGEWTEKTAATCTEAAVETRACACGEEETRTSTTGLALGHNWNWSTYTSGSGLRECQLTGCTVTAGIGDTGPAGGIIFYVIENGFDFYTGTAAADNNTVKRNYLEAWNSNETAATWGPSGFVVEDVRQVFSETNPTQWIGYGRRNTKIILTALGGDTLNRAARLCDNARHAGLDDWFLPSIDELNELHKIRGEYGIPNTGVYWSSSEFSTTANAGTRNFSNDNVHSSGVKSMSSFNVRSVRSF